jgi:prepilin-type N-terminal cleavage/methylation domain-containing protein
MNSRSPRGFTLVELVVVIAVIAMLGTFATPSFIAWHKRDQIDARARATSIATAPGPPLPTLARDKLFGAASR